MNILSAPQVKIKYDRKEYFRSSCFKISYLSLSQDFLLGVIKKIFINP